MTKRQLPIREFCIILCTIIASSTTLSPLNNQDFVSKSDKATSSESSKISTSQPADTLSSNVKSVTRSRRSNLNSDGNKQFVLKDNGNVAFNSAFRYNDQIMRNLLKSHSPSYARSHLFLSLLKPLDRRMTRYSNWDDHSVMHFGKRSAPDTDSNKSSLTDTSDVSDNDILEYDNSSKETGDFEHTKKESKNLENESFSGPQVDIDDMKEEETPQNPSAKKSKDPWDNHNTMHFGKRDEPWHSMMSFGKKAEPFWSDHNTMHFGKRDDPWHSMMSFGKKSEDSWNDHNTMHFGKRDDPWHNMMSFGKKSGDPWSDHNTMHFGKRDDPWHSMMSFGKKSEDFWNDHNTMHFGKRDDPWHNMMSFGKKSGNPWSDHNTMHFGKRDDPWHSMMSFGKKSEDSWKDHNTMHFGKKDDPWHSMMSFGKKSEDFWNDHNTMHFGKKDDPWHSMMSFGKKSEDFWNDHNTMHFGKRDDPWHNMMSFGKKSKDSWNDHNTMHFGKKDDPWHSMMSFGKKSENPWNDHNTMHFGKRDDPWHSMMSFGKKSEDSWNDHNTMHFGKRDDPWHNMMSFGKKSEDSWNDHNTMHFGKKDDPWHNMMSFGKKSEDSWNDHNTLHFGKRNDPLQNMMNIEEVPNPSDDQYTIHVKKREIEPWHDILNFEGKSPDNWNDHSTLHFGKKNDDPWHNMMSFGKKSENPWNDHNTMHFGKRDDDPWHNMMSFGKKSDDSLNEPLSIPFENEKEFKDDVINSEKKSNSNGNNTHLEQNAHPSPNMLDFSKRLDSSWDAHNTMHFGKRGENELWNNKGILEKKDNGIFNNHHTMHFGKKSKLEPIQLTNPNINLEQSFLKSNNDYGQILNLPDAKYFEKRSVHPSTSENELVPEKIYDKHMWPIKKVKTQTAPNLLYTDNNSENSKEIDIPNFKMSSISDDHSTDLDKKSEPWDSHNTMHFGKKSDPWNSHNTMHFGKRDDSWHNHNTMHFGKKSTMWNDHNTMHFGKKSDNQEENKFQKLNTIDSKHLFSKLNKQKPIELSLLTKTRQSKDLRLKKRSSNILNIPNVVGNESNVISQKSSNQLSNKWLNSDENKLITDKSVKTTNIKSLPENQLKATQTVTNTMKFKPQSNTDIKNNMENYKSVSLENNLRIKNNVMNLQNIENDSSKRNNKDNNDISNTQSKENTKSSENVSRVQSINTNSNINPMKSRIRKRSADIFPLDEMSYDKYAYSVNQQPNSFQRSTSVDSENKGSSIRDNDMNFEEPWYIEYADNFNKKSSPWDDHNTLHFGKRFDSWENHNTMHFGKKSDPWQAHNTMHFGKKSNPWDFHNTMHFGKKSDPWQAHNTMHFGKRSVPLKIYSALYSSDEPYSWEKQNIKKSPNTWTPHNVMHFGKRNAEQTNDGVGLLFNSINYPNFKYLIESVLAKEHSSPEIISKLISAKTDLYKNDKDFNDNNLFSDHKRSRLTDSQSDLLTSDKLYDISQNFEVLIPEFIQNPEKFSKDISYVQKEMNREENSLQQQPSESKKLIVLNAPLADDENKIKSYFKMKQKLDKIPEKRFLAPFQGPKSIVYPHAWLVSQIRRSTLPNRQYETRVAEKKEDPINSFMHFGRR